MRISLLSLILVLGVIACQKDKTPEPIKFTIPTFTYKAKVVQLGMDCGDWLIDLQDPLDFYPAPFDSIISNNSYLTRIHAQKLPDSLKVSGLEITLEMAYPDPVICTFFGPTIGSIKVTDAAPRID